MGNEQSVRDPEHAIFVRDIIDFLPKTDDDVSGGKKEDQNEFSELAMRAIHHMVFGAKKLLNGKPDPHEVTRLCTEIIACSRFLAKFGGTLQKGKLFVATKVTDTEENRLKHIALYEAPQLAAQGLMEHGKLDEGVTVLRAGAVAQKRYLGGEDCPDTAEWLRHNGAMAAKAGDKDVGADLQRAGALMHFRLLKQDGKLVDEALALELNVVGKKLASLGRFKEGIELEENGLDIRRHVLANKVALATATDASDDEAQKKAAAEDVTAAKYHLAYSLHDAGVAKTRLGIAPEEGVALLKESLQLRKEVAAFESGSNKHHKQDDLAKTYKDLGLAMQAVEGEEDKEAKEMLHQAHILYEEIVAKERAEKK